MLYEVITERFEVADSYDPQDLTGSAFGLIEGEPYQLTVRFGSPVAHLVRERRWHPSQTLVEQPDGASYNFV